MIVLGYTVLHQCIKELNMKYSYTKCFSLNCSRKILFTPSIVHPTSVIFCGTIPPLNIHPNEIKSAFAI